MSKPFLPRTDDAQAALIREGWAWYCTYGQRSAYAYLLHRHVPRALIARVLAADCRREDRAAARQG